MFGYWLSAHNVWCDRRLGIRTVGDVRPAYISLYRDATKSSPLSYSLIRRYVRALRLQPDDVVYDIGCGAGRPICVCARHLIARCVGIEMDPDMAAIAEANAARLAGRRSDIVFVRGDAATADYQSGTVFWLYNPFGPRTLAAVLDNIRRSVAAAPRKVRFCYAYPEHDAVFAASGWLTRYASVRPFLRPRYGASFWRN
jgi:SAM-dependent methyltransferase